MRINRLIACSFLGLALGGCSNQYLERKDTLEFSAGDAVDWNDAQQIANPAPRRANDTRIVADGQKAVSAVRRDTDGRQRWFRDKDEDMIDSRLPGDAGGGGGGPFAAGAGGPAGGGGPP
jgi:hypothetical protein